MTIILFSFLLYLSMRPHRSSMRIAMPIMYPMLYILNLRLVLPRVPSPSFSRLTEFNPKTVCLFLVAYTLSQYATRAWSLASWLHSRIIYIRG